MHSTRSILLAFTLPVLAALVPLNDTDNASLDPIDLVVTTGDNSTDYQCEEDWYLFGDKCYKYHNDMVGANFHDAITICEHTHRAQVVTIHSEEEAKFVNYLLFENHKSKFSAWVGLVRITNASFIWLDRSPLNYTNWAPNEPNNWNSKNFCVVISSEKSFLGKWYDVGCTSTYVVVCEKPKQLAELHREENLLEGNIQHLKSEYHHLEGNVSTLEANVQSMSNMVEVNFVLVIFIIVFLALFSLHSSFVRCFNHMQTHHEHSDSPIDREKLWSFRSDSSVDSIYVPSRLNRFCRSTLKRFKVGKSLSSPPLSTISTTYTANSSDSTLTTTSDNLATSI